MTTGGISVFVYELFHVLYNQTSNAVKHCEHWHCNTGTVRVKSGAERAAVLKVTHLCPGSAVPPCCPLVFHSHSVSEAMRCEGLAGVMLPLLQVPLCQPGRSRCCHVHASLRKKKKSWVGLMKYFITALSVQTFINRCQKIKACLYMHRQVEEMCTTWKPVWPFDSLQHCVLKRHGKTSPTKMSKRLTNDRYLTSDSVHTHTVFADMEVTTTEGTDARLCFHFPF